MLIDTHCHFNMMVGKHPNDLLTEEECHSIALLIEQSRQKGIEGFINVGTSLQESYNSCRIAQLSPLVYATVGIHPCDATEEWQNDIRVLEELLEQRDTHKIVGIGETGLDYYHQPYDKQRQYAVFERHIELAKKYALPLVIHVRDAGDDALDILRACHTEVTGVIHCFSLGIDTALEVTSWKGWYIGIDGPVTYKKNEWLRETVSRVPLTSLLLETDAPFLAPQQYRGKPNRPEYLWCVAECIAHCRGLAIDEVSQVTSDNAQQLFALDQ